jgi:hypothetical protein
MSFARSTGLSVCFFDTTETRLGGLSFEFETEFTFEPRDDKTLIELAQK